MTMKQILFLMSMIGSLFFSSCEDEYYDKVYEPLKCDYHGIEFSAYPSDFSKFGDIPAEGLEFSIIPDKKYEEIAFVSWYWEFDREGKGIVFEFPEGNPHLTDSDIKGEWGEISYDFSQSPHIINIKVNKNDLERPRELGITIGAKSGCYVDINLTQAAE